jgi:type I restriction enzyme S subunit
MDWADYIRGDTRSKLNQAVMLQIPMSVPPLAEQHRIVTKVDELMALCDRLAAQQADAASAYATLVKTLLDILTQSPSAADFAASWQRIARHFDTLFTTEASIDALKQTLLQLAVMGKLVPQNLTDEPASELLKRIQAERAKLVAEGKIKKDKPLPEIGEDEKPFELPEGWSWARFPELGVFGRGKSKHRPRNDPSLFNPGIYPLVQTGEVARAGTVIREYHSKYSELGLSQSKLWPQGTLCITIAANIADSAILGFEACFPDSVVGFIPSPLIGDSRYFLAFMKTAREHLLKFAPSTAQKNINLEILESVQIPLPPVSEMHRIVAKVDELMALCDQLAARIKTARELAANYATAATEAALKAA